MVLEDKGELQTAAASILMKILYAARMARFDLLRPTCRLACFITKWTTLCDKQLHRLVCYIHSSLSVRMIGWVGDQGCDLNPHAYADADLAGCCDSQRSTSGVHMAIEGPSSRFPISALSKRQGCVSTSTPEAEIVAAFTAYKSLLLPSIAIWEVVFAREVVAQFHEDNQAMIRVVQTGKTPTMRHINRVHRSSIAWLHEQLGNP